MRKDPEAKDKSSPRMRSERIRFLNIIYFVDSHRTRSLKFTIRTATITLVLMLALVSWSFIASGLLAHEYAINSELRAHTRGLLSSVFSYQTRFDEVYERAYPSDSTQNLAEEAPVEVPKEDDVIADAISATSGDDTLVTKDDKNEVDPVSPKAKVVSLAAQVAPPSKEIPIEIEKFTSSNDAKTLTVRFALKNLATPNKTSGTVTARAKYTDADGIQSYVEMREEETDDDGGGEGSDHSTGQHFNIRYYKNKIFRFDKPAEKPGTFAAIEVALKDDKGRSKTFSFPLKEAESSEPASEAQVDESELKGPFAKSTPEP